MMLSGCDKNSKQQTPEATIPVTTKVAELQLVNVSSKSTGSLNPRQAPIIRSQIAGEIDKLLVHEGEEVRKGQMLLKINHKEMQLLLDEAKAKMLQSKALLKEAERSVQRADKLIGKGYVSQEQYDQIHGQYETAKANLVLAESDLAHAEFQMKQTNVLSPINGQIGQIRVSEGEYVTANNEMLNIINHDELLAELPLSEQKSSTVSKGQKIVLTSPTSPDQSLTTTVTFISPNINPDNRAIKVLVVFANKFGWKPGSSVDATIFSDQLKAIMIPEESIVTRENKKTVYIIKNNKAVAKSVETGYETEGWVQVTKGVAPGDQVVVTGAYYLSDGSPITIQK